MVPRRQHANFCDARRYFCNYTEATPAPNVLQMEFGKPKIFCSETCNIFLWLKICRQFGYDKSNRSQGLTSCSDKCVGLRDTPLGQASTILRVSGEAKQVHIEYFCMSDFHFF